MISTTLQIVLGYADLLLLGKVKEGQDYQRAAAIRAAAKRGSDLVRRNPHLQPKSGNETSAGQYELRIEAD